MFEALGNLFQDATRARLLLLLNHVLSAEPVAMERLQPWAGQTVALTMDGLPAPMRLVHLQPTWMVRITPAGLFESAAEAAQPPDLEIHVDASNPLLAALRAASGQRPTVHIDGSAALAAEIDWLIENLRWDVEDDLAKVVGPAVAHQLAQLGRAVAEPLKRLAGGLGGLAGSGAGAGAGPGPAAR
jgi:ubiquinone biosynthesis accessory factor UbiJ